MAKGELHAPFVIVPSFHRKWGVGNDFKWEVNYTVVPDRKEPYSYAPHILPPIGELKV